MIRPAWHEYLIANQIPMHEHMTQCSICPARAGEQHVSVEIEPRTE